MNKIINGLIVGLAWVALVSILLSKSEANVKTFTAKPVYGSEVRSNIPRAVDGSSTSVIYSHFMKFVGQAREASMPGRNPLSTGIEISTDIEP